jgi:Clp amino terminal domain, pathogenicity island component
MELKNTPELDRILKLAAIEAEREQAGVVGVHHFLCALAMDAANVGADLFQRQGLTLQDLRTLDFDKKPAQP